MSDKILLTQISIILNSSNSPPTEFLCLPRGEYKTTKGTVLIDDLALSSVTTSRAALATDVLIDYEHQSEMSWRNGQPVPAAGWVPCTSLESRADGLWATNIQWTPRALEMLANREYRYFSPVIQLYQGETDPYPRAMALDSLALTNMPASIGQKPLVASKNNPLESETLEQNGVTMKTFAIMLGLAENATENDFIKRCQSILVLTGAPTFDAAEGVITAWKSSHEEKLALSARVKQLEQSQLDLETKALEATKAEMIKVALSQGQLTPALEPWAQSQSIETLKGFLSASTPLPMIKVHLEPTLESKLLLNDAEKQTAKLMGISEKDFLESKLSGGE